jgi:winged helix DNA-binding protein
VPEVVGRLLAVPAQDLRAARLAVRARTIGLAAADVDAALTADRSVVVAWLGRGTLHLARAEDHAWLLALTAPPRLAANRRRLGQEGVSPGDAERAVGIVERALAAEGPLTRPELAARIAGHGIRAEGQATPHLLMLAALRGVVVLGPVRDGTQAFALAHDWLGAAAGPPGATGRDGARPELARRYLVAHGPATAADLAAWAGLPLGDARRGLAAIAGELEELGGELVDLRDRRAADAPAPARLLGAFDPYLLGWRDRGFAVAPDCARRVHPGGGIVRATATVGGEAVGTWSARRRGERLSVTVDPFAVLPPAASRALRADAADVARFEGRRLSEG